MRQKINKIDRELKLSTIAQKQKDKDTLNLYVHTDLKTVSGIQSYSNYLLLSGNPYQNFKSILNEQTIYVCSYKDFSLPLSKINKNDPNRDSSIGNVFRFSIKSIEPKEKTILGEERRQTIVELTRFDILKKERKEIEEKLEDGEVLNGTILKLLTNLGALVLLGENTISFLPNSLFSDNYYRVGDVYKVGDTVRVKKRTGYPFRKFDSDDLRLFVSPEEKYSKSNGQKLKDAMEYLNVKTMGVTTKQNEYGIFVHVPIGLDILCFSDGMSARANQFVSVRMNEILGYGIILEKQGDDTVTGKMTGIDNKGDAMVKIGDQNNVLIKCKFDYGVSHEDTNVNVKITGLRARGKII